MSYIKHLIDDSCFIRVVWDNNDSDNINKDDVKFHLTGNSVFISDNSGYYKEIDYTKLTAPVVASASLLFDAIKTFADTNPCSSGGGGGTQTLNQTLVLGNTTGGEDISISNGDKIVLDNGSELRAGTYDFGGTGGISRICSVGYEDMWQSGIHHIFDNNGYIRESNNCFNYVPDNTFDNTLRFKVGSRWVLDDGTTYKCTDATTGAAIWVAISGVVLNNDNSDIDPTSSDDSSLGYSTGINSSKWFNKSTGVWWVCIDASIGSAVWQSDFDVAGVRTIDEISVGAGVVVQARSSVKIQTSSTSLELTADTLKTDSAISAKAVEAVDTTGSFVGGAYIYSNTKITTPRNITLPAISSIPDGTIFIFRCESTTALNNFYMRLVADVGNPDTIGGLPNYDMFNANQCVMLVSNLATNDWRILFESTHADKTIVELANGTITGNAVVNTTTALTWNSGKSYTDYIPLFYVFKYVSGTVGIAVGKMKNSANDLTGALTLVGLTSTQEASVNNNQLVLHPDSGDISFQLTTAGLGASSFTITAFGVKR